MDLGVVLFYEPIFNILVGLYRLFGGNFGLAIIGLAILSRLITFPLTIKQIEMAETSQDMSEKIKEVKEKYKDDQEQQAKELMKVQSEYIPGQLGGCLGLIVQLIMVINILNVITNLVDRGVEAFNEVAYSFVPQFSPDAVINKDFLGVIDLGTTATQVAEGGIMENLEALLPYVLLALFVGVTQYASSKIMMGLRNKGGDDEESQESGKKKSKQSKKSKKKKDSEPDLPQDFGEILQRSTKQTMFILPVIIVVSTLNFPAAFGIYWTVQNGFVIIQQLIIDRMIKKDGSSTA